MQKVSIIDMIAKKLRRCIAIVEDGDTASQAIASGKFVIWKGNPCKASTAISAGATLSNSNLTALSDGIGNELNGKLITVEEDTLDTNNEGVLTYIYNPGLKLCIIIWHGNSTVPTAETRVKTIGLPTKLLKKGSSTPITPLMGGGYMEINSSQAYLNLPLAAWSAGSIMYFTNN